MLLKWAVPASRRFFVGSHMKRPKNPPIARSPACGLMQQNRAQHTLGEERGEEVELSDPGWPRGRRRRILSTLTPSLLMESDHLDLSQKHTISLSFPLTTGLSYNLYYELDRKTVPTPFPAHVRGFFYFGPRPGLPPLAASLRFRCTPTAHPSSFDDGHDLLLPDGLPWQRLLVQAVVSTIPTLRDQLLREGHLTLDGLEKWRKRVDGHGARVFSSLWLFGLHQQFPVDFGGGINLVVVGEERIHFIRMNDTFVDKSGGSDRNPFKGSALAHFERSPTDPHILRLRIAEVLEPVVASIPDAENSRIVLPRAGELFSVRRLGTGRSPLLPGDGKPWAFDLRADTKRARALRVLAENG
ncbi:hypothetical protein DFH07DRAFT_806489 [Mycena maculata]|uniref:Uncharacterized protein n=1 Tax=Mycena maculata TaxID=230809 RepID=A0AAD7NP29_9AGAR|nr:hypothetical protein DFH07DRAFT_806489 [Mycena maculata]